MKYIVDIILAGLLILFVSASVYYRSAEAETAEMKTRYMGEVEGVKIYLVCVDGQWLAFSIKPGSEFHILAPYLKEAGIGVDLPKCDK